MTEERSCGTCGHYVSDRCVRPGGCCFHHSNWQPIEQEKPMENKVVFESDEQYKNIMKETCVFTLSEEGLNNSLKKAKQKGYIRKSAVEEAEEEYLNYKSGNNCYVAEIVLDKMYSAIQKLKSEIARLKG